MSETKPPTLAINIEFGGGLELLFGNVRKHRLDIPSTIVEQGDKPADLDFLIHYLKDNLLKEREELFVEEGTVRPGILVLINDTDWELEGEGEYKLKNDDEIVFISTLHGG
ncbi:ubiquitin related modifier 1 [Fistulina hepatica ATCC 64428]|uniref:Ubiquitin-related modifier 1 n=1 Tax=Fistulina hepatica ATCC 64428 TaxID=1128425 RepID=A0A0D7AG12_9AGAR|nr:ubiquitin related modifier 1 [Fistulina hepatica ATCC 64428]